MGEKVQKVKVKEKAKAKATKVITTENQDRWLPTLTMMGRNARCLASSAHSKWWVERQTRKPAQKRVPMMQNVLPSRVLSASGVLAARGRFQTITRGLRLSKRVTMRKVMRVMTMTMMMRVVRKERARERARRKVKVRGKAREKVKKVKVKVKEKAKAKVMRVMTTMTMMRVVRKERARGRGRRRAKGKAKGKVTKPKVKAKETKVITMENQDRWLPTLTMMGRNARCLASSAHSKWWVERQTRKPAQKRVPMMQNVLPSRVFSASGVLAARRRFQTITRALRLSKRVTMRKVMRVMTITMMMRVVRKE